MPAPVVVKHADVDLVVAHLGVLVPDGTVARVLLSLSGTVTVLSGLVTTTLVAESVVTFATVSLAAGLYRVEVELAGPHTFPTDGTVGLLIQPDLA